MMELAMLAAFFGAIYVQLRSGAPHVERRT